MPILDGWEACRRIRTHRPNTPMLMLTVHTEPHDYERGVAAGVTGYMSKPFDPDALIDEVVRLVGQV
jgi:CheY-like chemotaxis protein